MAIDLRDVFAKDKVLDFWPTNRQSAEERVLSTTRFIIYAMVLLYLIRRDARIIALGVLVLAALYALYVSNMIPDGVRMPSVGPKQVNGYRMPTHDNPMANFLMGDDPAKTPSAPWYPSMKREVQKEWETIHPFEKLRDAERNFYTAPVTSWPNDQAAFAQNAYGRPFEPQCRDDPSACDPEGNPFARFPERVQIRGGNGR